MCPELYLRRPFHTNVSSRLDALLEAKAKQGVQVNFTVRWQVGVTILNVLMILFYRRKYSSMTVQIQNYK